MKKNNNDNNIDIKEKTRAPGIKPKFYSKKSKGKNFARKRFFPNLRNLHFVKPSRKIIISFFCILVTVAIIVGAFMLLSSRSSESHYPSPLTIKDTQVSNAEFNFMYHYVLVENSIDINTNDAKELLDSEYSDEFPTYRDYYLDTAAKELQEMYILYDDATENGYSISETNIESAQIYIDALGDKATAIGVSLDTYLKGYFGTNTTEELAKDILSKKFFSDAYASGPKLKQLSASDSQAEQAYSEDPNGLDVVNYRMLHIVFDEATSSFINTAQLHAQAIIDGIGHDESQFETVAAAYFTGEEKEAILQKDSTLISYVHYNSIADSDWRAWLFDPEREPGDCTIFDDPVGFPILICFSSRTRQIEPSRDVYLVYASENTTVSGGVLLSDQICDLLTDVYSFAVVEDMYSDLIDTFELDTVRNTRLFKGSLNDDLDSWIFDPARKPGDKTVITTEGQNVVTYYVSKSNNEEWYERVNSSICLNNYDAFILEKQLDYPYTFLESGLRYITDVPN